MRDAGSAGGNGSIYLNNSATQSSYVVRIKSKKDRLDSSTFGDLEDFFAKFEGFDRSLLQHGSSRVNVKHYLEDPYFVDGEWTCKVLIELGFNKRDFAYIPLEVLPRLHDYLNQCRYVIFYDMFPATESKQIDSAVSAITNYAGDLSNSLNQKFVPNTTKILRNLADIMSRSEKELYQFMYVKPSVKENALEEDRFIQISNVLHKILVKDESIATEPYDKSLFIESPNYYEKNKKWDFRVEEKKKSYYILDHEWLDLLFSRKVQVGLGCSLNVTMDYGPVGRFKKDQPYISKVYGVVEPRNLQIIFPFSNP